MSNLITLRNKIRTIQTIEKITRTMRLTSMAEHTTLQKSGGQLRTYIEHLKILLKKIICIKQQQKKIKAIEETTRLYKKEYLCIIIGSQKGLCGNFNTKLLSVVETFLQDKAVDAVDFALVGKQLFSFVTIDPRFSVVYSEPLFSHKNRDLIIEQLIKFFNNYQKVYVISNQFHTFFFQPSIISLVSIPYETFMKESLSEKLWHEQYLFEENIDDILEVLTINYIRSQFAHVLHQSLLAEYAARFTAMDSATKNSEQMLEETKLLFNKLRQAKITTEITELSSNF